MGRKPALTEREVEALVKSIAPPKILAKLFGISLGTVYRYIRLSKRAQIDAQERE